MTEQEKKHQEKVSSLRDISRCYRVVLSSKVEIPCDSDEVASVIAGIQSGSVVRLRQGVFNPSFFVSLVPDDKRQKAYLNDLLAVSDYNRQQFRYHGGTDLRKLPEFQLLGDIFGDSLPKLGNGRNGGGLPG